MNADKKLAVTLLLAAVSTVILAQTGCRLAPALARLEDSAAAASLRGATSVSFIDQSGKHQPIVVSDSDGVQRLLSEIHLVPEPGAAYDDCARIYVAVFERPSGLLRMFFCSHCCELIEGTGPPDHGLGKYYKTPRAFYAQFLALAREREWDVEAP